MCIFDFLQLHTCFFCFIYLLFIFFAGNWASLADAQTFSFLLETFVPIAYEFVESKSSQTDSKRLLGILILREMIEHAKNVASISGEINAMTQKLWTPLLHENASIREASFEVYKIVLSILAKRPQSVRVIIANICERCSSALERPIKELLGSTKTNNSSKKKRESEVHGALLLCSELFKYSHVIASDTLQRICDRVLSYQNYQSKQIILAIIQLIPTLFHVCIELKFGDHYNVRLTKILNDWLKDKEFEVAATHAWCQITSVLFLFFFFFFAIYFV